MHNNDVDPWPSDPHGHIYEDNLVIDKDGNIYNKTTKKFVMKLCKKALAKWLAFLVELDSAAGAVDIIIVPDAFLQMIQSPSYSIPYD